jgi:hypothetical protein
MGCADATVVIVDMASVADASKHKARILLSCVVTMAALTTVL